MKVSKDLLIAALIGLLAVSASTGRLMALDDAAAVGTESGSDTFAPRDQLDSQRNHRGPHRRGPGGFGREGRMGVGGPGGPGGPGGLMMALRGLDLSESQRAEIRNIFEQDRLEGEAHRETMRALGADLESQIETDPFDEEAVRAKAAAVASQGVEMAVLRARQMGQIRNVLTPEQLDRLAQMKEERKALREERRQRFERHREPRAGS